MTKIFVASLSALSLAGALFATSAFADVSSQLTIASTHAGFAAKAPTIDGAHMHLHHVVNCLVGPSGTGFDAKPGNPCAKAGNGAIADSTDAAQKAKLQAAVATAQEGIASSDLATAQKDATSAGAAIDAAK